VSLILPLSFGGTLIHFKMWYRRSDRTGC